MSGACRLFSSTPKTQWVDPAAVGATGRVSDADAEQDSIRYNHITMGMSGSMAMPDANEGSLQAHAMCGLAESRVELPGEGLAVKDIQAPAAVGVPPTGSPEPAASSAAPASGSAVPAAGSAAPAAGSAAPAVLVRQGVAAKRKRDVDETKVQRNKAARSNPWMCICMPMWPPSSGRQWHEAQCPRKQFSDGALGAPEVGTKLTCLACAGPRAGFVYECKKPNKDGWVRVV